MEIGSSQPVQYSSVHQELLYYVARFLESGPFQDIGQKLQRELEKKRLLPRRTDWLGGQHPRTFTDMVHQDDYVGVGSSHLLELFTQAIQLFTKEQQQTSSSSSATPQLLNSMIKMKPLSKLLDTRICDPKRRVISCETICQPRSITANLPPSLPPRRTCALLSREVNGFVHTHHLVPVCAYEAIKRQTRLFGHLAAIYCVSFDRSGRYIFTGADDGLVKVWETATGRLLATLRGHSMEVVDLDVNRENTLVAAGCCDKYIRVWGLANASPVAVLKGHTGSVTLLYVRHSQGWVLAAVSSTPLSVMCSSARGPRAPPGTWSRRATTAACVSGTTTSTRTSLIRSPSSSERRVNPVRRRWWPRLVVAAAS